ncbi:hypothetical protein AMTRI_Chr11g96430 [Amborella trichopoda]|uniref:Transcription factor CBF/NF-Y/archaeal histone domain-containing protein n=1 Tax=Amborella trichopoda TaxID=13333 RepID=U5D852_AMBTC|nr:DNA polymerase epsilon subunit 3 [Amborella trichopoda]ERN16538.1 hypothetical protein AMTR_s00031p00134850 [Amborella trichopoda]|eukprot:XP_006855071.1 DNA polymerase epsilon subunit 3 [Amborella trichopoda]
MEVDELPRSIVKRMVKEKLSYLSKVDDEPSKDVNISNEALSAFSESARIFIHYLSATANDICQESKRQTINAEDVFKALEEIDFPEFTEPLRVSLEDFRKKKAFKKSKETNKKRKSEEEPESNVIGSEGKGEETEEGGHTEKEDMDEQEEDCGDEGKEDEEE